MLREMARHRGLKLVKSRRRKPGAGDYGRYGLADAKDKPCFGFGEEGLTATPEEIETYLRRGEVASWKRSLMTSVGGKAPEAPAAAKEAAPRKAKRTVKPAKAAPRPPPLERPLRVRKATRKDADALAALLSAKGRALAAGLEALLKAKQPPLVADKGGLVGCLAWAAVPRLDAPPLGRVTLLLVAEEARRQGIGTALMQEAERRLGDLGCAEIEAPVAIELGTDYVFFRKLGYARVGYRFVREG